jgi:hypothetical protein
MADDPPPPPYLAAMMEQFDLNRQFMAGVMAQLPNHNAPITLQEFVRLNPSVFRSSANPMDADDWLREIAVQMESAAVAPDCFVTFATYHLRGPAAQWWESHKLALPDGTVTTWQEFQIAFRAWHIPQGMMDQKKEEFRQLRQGQTTVDEYHRKFLELSRYAEKDVATDARKQERFREGLQPEIELTLALFDCADFATLVSKAFQAETALTKHRESLKRARDAGPSSGRPVQKLRVWIPHNVHHRPAPTRGRLMLHLACLRHQGSCRFRLGSQGTLLPTVARFNLRMHHLPSMVVKSVEIVVPEKVIPSHLLLNVVMPIMLMLRRLRKIRLS